MSKESRQTFIRSIISLIKVGGVHEEILEILLKRKIERNDSRHLPVAS